MGEEGLENRIPIKPGLFSITDDGKEGYLIGGQCSLCKEIFFPKRPICPHCTSEQVAGIPLNKRGRLHSYTIARTSMPNSIMEPPFVSGIVELEMRNRLRIVSLITGFDQGAVRIGAEVELCFLPAGEDQEGNQLMAFAFRAVSI